MRKNGQLMALSSVLPMAALGVFVMAGSRSVSADCDGGPATCCYASSSYSLGACKATGCSQYQQQRCEAPTTPGGWAWWSVCQNHCESWGS